MHAILRLAATLLIVYSVVDCEKYSIVQLLRRPTTVLMEYKSTTFNSFEKGSKLFFPSLFTVYLSLLPFYMKFEQFKLNKWTK